jgi:hypothetical protein
MDIKFDLSAFGSLLAEPEAVCDLADERIVELLVRGFVDQALAGFHRALGGEAELDDVVMDLNHVAVAYNAVFLGFSGIEKLKIHSWNAPDQLGVFLRDTVGLEYPPNDTVRAALIQLATQVMLCIQQSEEDWKTGVERMIGQVRDLLLGRLPEGYEDAQPLPFE